MRFIGHGTFFPKWFQNEAAGDERGTGDSTMYTDAEDVHHVLTHLGAVERHEDRWLVTLDDGAQVLVALDGTHHAVAMTAELGSPPEHGRAAMCELLMTYTALMSATGGVAMAMNGQGGDFLQTCLLPLECVTAPMLGTIIHDFAARAQLWRQVIADGAVEAATPFGDTVLASAWARA